MNGNTEEANIEITISVSASTLEEAVTEAEFITKAVEEVAEARAAAIVDMFPEQAPATTAGKPIEPAEYLAAINGLLGSLRYFVLGNARLADELDYIRRRVERLEQIKGS